MRAAILSTLTAVLLLAFTLPALAQPKLTILYSGNNHGTLRPCPT